MPEDKLIHEILPVGMLQCNCHILGDPHTHEELVIDPGDDAERILGVIARHQLTVRAIVITHTHIDHVVGLHRLHQATGAPVRVHPDDFDLYRMLDVQARWLGWRAPQAVKIDDPLNEGDTLRWGNFAARVLHTPGHTQGSVCLYLPASGTIEQSGQIKQPEPGRLFAGDTLFAGSIGRTDLWGGSFETIMRSLKGKVMELPDETIVYPGHGGETTIGEERQSNPFLNRS